MSETEHIAIGLLTLLLAPIWIPVLLLVAVAGLIAGIGGAVEDLCRRR